jgi:hypothetical protein
MPRAVSVPRRRSSARALRQSDRPPTSCSRPTICHPPVPRSAGWPLRSSPARGHRTSALAAPSTWRTARWRASTGCSGVSAYRTRTTARQCWNAAVLPRNYLTSANRVLDSSNFPQCHVHRDVFARHARRHRCCSVRRRWRAPAPPRGRTWRVATDDRATGSLTSLCQPSPSWVTESSSVRPPSAVPDASERCDRQGVGCVPPGTRIDAARDATRRTLARSRNGRIGTHAHACTSDIVDMNASLETADFSTGAGQPSAIVKRGCGLHCRLHATRRESVAIACRCVSRAK